MTRETKIGLVIGCSFLILVGLVVASKWHGTDDPLEPELQDNQNPPVKLAQANVDHKDKDGSKKHADTLPSLPVAPQKKVDPDKGGLRNVNDLVMPGPINFGPPSEQDKKIAQLQAKIREDEKPVLPALPLGGFPQNDVKPIDDKKGGFIAPPMPVDIQVKPIDKKDPYAVPPPTGFGQDLSAKPFGSLDNKKGPGGVDMPPNFGPLGKDPMQIKPFDDRKGPSAVELPPNFGPLAKDPMPIKPFDDRKGPPGVETPPNFGPLGKDPLPKPFDDKKGPGGVELPPNFGPTNKDPFPVKPFDDKKGPGGIELPPNFGPINKDPQSIKPPEVPTIVPFKDPNPVKTPDGPKDNGPLPMIPPFGNNNSTPPINVNTGGVKPPLPMVRDSSPDLYECRQGETSFATLSQRLYGSDRYAEALQAYNRTHSGALKNGSLLTLNPPILNPGQQVLVPPKDLLERDVRTPTINVPSPPNMTPAVKLAPVSPVGGVGVAPITAPSIGSGRNYVVRNPNGESILDIAEQTLGKRDRWTDIYRLNQSNPNVQPQSLLRIPAGTDLKMPTN